VHELEAEDEGDGALDADLRWVLNDHRTTAVRVDRCDCWK
jgi:hypothetical protein